MRRILVVLLAVSVVVIIDPDSILGQQGPPPVTAPGAATSRLSRTVGNTANSPFFNPNTPTIWHRLGVPQGVGRFKLFRQSRVNRRGDNPQREAKPKLLALTDPANLDPKAPEMLKAAAEIKMAEDLAPQKLKALKYLGTIGCGCYDEGGKIQAALIEALADCTPAVRTEALNTIMAQVSGDCCTCSCPEACNAKSCCTRDLYDRMEEMANKTDDYGCPVEPDPAVRCLAMKVLNACPVPPPKEEEEEEEKKEGDTPDEGGAKSSEGETKDPANEENGSDDQPAEADENASRSTRRGTSKVSYRGASTRLPGSPSLNSYPVADREFMRQFEVTGVVRDVNIDEGIATIVFDDPYEFPSGLNMVIATNPNNVSFGILDDTQTGTAVIKVEDYGVLTGLKKLQRVRMGVFQ